MRSCGARLAGLCTRCATHQERLGGHEVPQRDLAAGRRQPHPRSCRSCAGGARRRLHDGVHRHPTHPHTPGMTPRHRGLAVAHVPEDDPARGARNDPGGVPRRIDRALAEEAVAVGLFDGPRSSHGGAPDVEEEEGVGACGGEDDGGAKSGELERSGVLRGGAGVQVGGEMRDGRGRLEAEAPLCLRASRSCPVEVAKENRAVPACSGAWKRCWGVR